MTGTGTSAPIEESTDDTSRPVVVWVARRGYAWALALGVWTDEHHQWFAERRCSPRRMISADILAFLRAFNGEFDLGQVEIRAFDHRRDEAVVLPFHLAADWFGGLASEAMSAPSAR